MFQEQKKIIERSQTGMNDSVSGELACYGFILYPTPNIYFQKEGRRTVVFHFFFLKKKRNGCHLPSKVEGQSPKI